MFRSWNGPRAIAYREREHIAHDLGTAVNVQAMVFGNRDDNSGTGVGFTRDPATGAKGAYGDFLVNAQGEDVVAGIRNTEPISELKKQFPKVHAELLKIFARLEAHYRDMCDTEFTIEQGKLWMLQTRVGKRTGAAALKMAVDMVRPSDLGISKAEAVSRITEDHLDSVLHPQFAGSGYAVWAKGLGASPGAAVGRIYFTADDAAAAAERGEQVVLVRNETSPEDVHGMLASEGILTARGGLVSHAAVVARGWGKPAVVGAEVLRLGDHQVTVGDVTLYEGDWVSLDGGAGIVVAGQVPLTAASPPAAFDTVLSWADDIRKGHLAVRANADTGDDAANARKLGAEGIGLCRTEHMFLGEDRLPVVRRMILAHSPAEEAAALEELRARPARGLHRHPGRHGRAAGDGAPARPAAARVPALHRGAGAQGGHGRPQPRGAPPLRGRAVLEGGQPDARHPRRAARGDQARPLRHAGARPHGGGPPAGGRRRASDRRDHDPAHGDPGRAGAGPGLGRGRRGRGQQGAGPPAPSKGAAKASAAKAGTLEVTIGTMIETPRAALRADEIAEVADFFSFGTNDLTQMTFGFSRDDVEGRMMDAYLELGLLPRNPFEVVDFDGVGELVRLGTERGRSTRPGLKVGVCGEHGGDPPSIGLFYDAGLDYVSCSPFRVPVARLAAAQAVLAGRRPRRRPGAGQLARLGRPPGRRRAGSAGAR